MMIIATTLLAVAANAPIGETVGIGGDEDVVWIRVQNASPQDTTIKTDDDRIIVLLSKAPQAESSISAKDRTVKRVELLEDPPRLSVQTKYGPRTTRGLAKHSAVEIDDGGFTLRISRSIEKPLPAAEKSAEKADETKPEPAPVAPAVEAAPRPAAPVAAPLAQAAPSVEAPRTPIALAPESESGPFRAWAISLVALIGAGVVIVAAKKKRVAADVGANMKTIAAHSMGPKCKIVLIAVRDRELLLSVGEKGAELIADLTDDHGSTKAPAFSAAKRDSYPALDEAPPLRDETSPALSGLLALKRQANDPAAPAWAKKLATQMRKEAIR